MRSKLFLLFLIIFLQSCKTKNIIDGYIIQEVITDKQKKVSFFADNFFIPLKAIEVNKDGINHNNFFYLRFPDIKEVSLCCQDSTYLINNEQKKEVYKLIKNEIYNYFDLIDEKKYLTFTLNDTLNVKIFKVKTKHCYCSNKYSVHPKMSKNKKLIYVFDCLFYKFSRKEKKYFKNRKEKILEGISNPNLILGK